jgi:hypothetical protein
VRVLGLESGKHFGSKGHKEYTGKEASRVDEGILYHGAGIYHPTDQQLFCGLRHFLTQEGSSVFASNRSGILFFAIRPRLNFCCRVPILSFRTGTEAYLPFLSDGSTRVVHWIYVCCRFLFFNNSLANFLDASKHCRSDEHPRKLQSACLS